MNHRTGATLVEVLVAIFVTALGLLALLALFPIGAFSMAQALKDSRCTQASINANSWASVLDLRNDPYVIQTPTNAYLTPGPAWPDLTTLASYDDASYPVYVDPIGVSLGATVLGQYSGPPANSPGIPRRSISLFYPPYTATFSQTFQKYFTLADDITFADNGLPSMPGGFVEREGRYTYAYMLRRPKWYAPQTADVTVVVYSGRSTAVLGETAYSTDFVVGTNTITLTWNPGQEKPNLRVGNWVLDATVVNPASGAPEPHGFFYRVVNITETTITNLSGQPQPALILELQTAIRRGTLVGTGQGVLVVMDNVVEVFEKGAGRPQ